VEVEVWVGETHFLLQKQPLQGILLHSKYQDAINCPSEIKAIKGRIAKKKIEDIASPFIKNHIFVL
jgi:hypothetical protein